MATEGPSASVGEEQLRDACAELDRRLRAGEPASVEELLDRLPGLSADSVLELIYTEFVAREELGRQLDPAAWFARFPLCRERLGRLLQVHQALHNASLADTDVAGATPGDTDFALTPEVAERAIAGYEILQELGRGGMGVVYKARQARLNRLVALKMILSGDLSGPVERARFQEEAQAAARLQHPNIVQVFEVGVSGGRPFLALEYVEGGSLAQRLAEGPLPPRAAATFVATLAHAIHYAHGRGVIHRDLKPANVLLASGGCEPPGRRAPPGGSHPPLAEWVPKITDFGLAKQVSEGSCDPTKGGLTRTGVVLGTPSYMAPEQAAGRPADLGPAVDIYALGAILYETLTGRPPFRAATPLATLEQVRTQEPLSPARLQPELPRDLETICLKCLEKDPGRRYASGQELAEDLERFQRGEPIRARPTSGWERGVKWARRRPAIAGLLAALAIVTIASFAAVTHMWQQTATALSGERDARQTAEANLAARNIALARYEWLDFQLDRARAYLQDCPPEYRDDLWHYLHWACTAEVATLGPHAGTVNALAYRPDGGMLAVAHGGSSVTLWDVTTRQEAFRFSDAAGIYQYLGFDPQGTHVCHICGMYSTLGTPMRSSQSLSVWDVAQGKRVRSWSGASGYDRARFSRVGPFRVAVVSAEGVRVDDVLTGESIRTIALRNPQFDLSPDGTLLAALDSANAISVWDLATGARIALFEANPGTTARQTHLIALAGDGRRLAHAITREKPPASRITIWDYRAEKVVAEFSGHENDISSLAFSPDATLLATASLDRSVILWDAMTGNKLLILRGHTDRVNCLAFSPDGRYLASGGNDRTVRIWDVRPE